MDFALLTSTPQTSFRAGSLTSLGSLFKCHPFREDFRYLLLPITLFKIAPASSISPAVSLCFNALNFSLSLLLNYTYFPLLR